MPNVEQAAYWDGSGGEHWVAQQERYDKMSGGFGDRLVEASRQLRENGSSTWGAGMGR